MKFRFFLEVILVFECILKENCIASEPLIGSNKGLSANLQRSSASKVVPTSYSKLRKHGRKRKRPPFSPPKSTLGDFEDIPAASPPSSDFLPEEESFVDEYIPPTTVPTITGDGFPSTTIPAGETTVNNTDESISSNSSTTSPKNEDDDISQSNNAFAPIPVSDDIASDEADEDSMLESSVPDFGEEYEEDELFSVDVAVQIQAIRDIDEANQKVILELDLLVHWKDYDLLPETGNYEEPTELENVTLLLEKYESEPITLEEFDDLWKPDLFIERVEKVTRPDLLTIPISVRTIRDTSSVVYTTRASIQVDCDMDFQYYPADTQNCYLNMRSYQDDESEMNLRWNPLPGAYLVDTGDDNFDIQLEHVAQRKKRVKDINLNDSIFHVLQMKLSMRRKISYHLIQTYIPSAFLVFITWLSFLIPEDLIEARIGISMTNLLTLTAMFSAVRENTPIVSYVKAIDIWMVYCIFIVFSTLLEFALFVWLRNYKISKREKELGEQLKKEEVLSTNDVEVKIEDGGTLTVEEISSKAIEAFEKTAKWFNRFAFSYFVLNFVIFNIIYWSWIFNASNYWNWKINTMLNGDNNGGGGFIDEL